MKNQYLILRMKAPDLYNNEFLMRGFNRKRIDQVIGIIVIVTDALNNSFKDDIYHLKHVRIDLLQSDTQQNWARLSWSGADCDRIDMGMRRLPVDLANAVRAMRNNRLYCITDTNIQYAFRDRFTNFVYGPSAVRRIIDREKTGTLNDFTVEEIVANLKTRIKGVTITF